MDAASNFFPLVNIIADTASLELVANGSAENDINSIC